MTKKIAVYAAFACDPRLPSEPSIGWDFLNALASVAEPLVDLDVVAFMNHRSSDITIQRWANRPPINIIGVRLPRLLKFLENPKLTRFEYLVWNFRVRLRLKALEKNNEVVFAHHTTFASEMLPTPISVLGKSTMKVWGPVGSSGNADVYRISPRNGSWRFNYIVQILRNVLSHRMALQNSRNIDLVLTTSEELSVQLESKNRKTLVFPNTILDLSSLDSVKIDSTVDSLSPAKKTIVCVGNLIYLKRFELAIAALATSVLADARLIIIGKPAPGDENYLTSFTRDFGVSDRVHFTGQIPRSEVLEYMRTADVIFHPSAREGGSGVVGEATSLGVPVVCFEKTGSAVVLRAARTSGIVITAVRADANMIAHHLAKAMELPRLPTQLWSYKRYVDLERELLSSALGGSHESM